MSVIRHRSDFSPKYHAQERPVVTRGV